MTIIFSYSLLDQHDKCPEAARHLFILRDFKKTYTVEGGIDAHRELEQRIRYQKLLPAPLASAEPLVKSFERAGNVEVEVALAVGRDRTASGFWEKPTYLRGKFDVVLRQPGTRSAFIGDWKTGKVREASDQLEIGAMLLMSADTAIDTVMGANIWLQVPKIGLPYKFTRSMIDSYWLKWLARMQAIEKLDANAEWEKREGPLCSYCPVKTCGFYRGG